MRPHYRKLFERLEEAVANCGDVISSRVNELTRMTNERDELIKTKWQLQRRVTVLQEAGSDYDSIKEHNTALLQEREEVRKRLGQILACIQALDEEFRS